MTIVDLVPQAALTRCAKLLAITGVLYMALIAIGFHHLYQDDTEGIGALLQIIGTLYSVLYAFATYVIWGQFTAVENEIRKESGALKDLILFSVRLKETAREPIVRAVKIYARAVVETEWGALARNDATEKTDRLFLNVISSVTELKVEDENERVIYQRLLDIAGEASTHRDERLALSVKRIPRTLLAFVITTALSILFLLLLYPFRNVPLGVTAVAITTMLLFFAHFVVTDLDNPFEGAWNVSSDLFGDLITKLR